MGKYSTLEPVNKDNFNNINNLLFEHLTDLTGDFIGLKNISLIMEEGLADKIKLSPSKYLANETLVDYEEYNLAISLNLEKKQMKDYAIITIDTALLSLLMFEDKLDSLWRDKPVREIKELVMELVFLHTHYQEELISMIKEISATIKKKQNINNVIIGKISEDYFEDNLISNEEAKFTIQELAEMWGMTSSNLRMVIMNNKFNESKIEKRGGAYLIPLSEMERVFGDFALYNIRKIKRIIKFNQKEVTPYKKELQEALSELLNIISHFPESSYLSFKENIIHVLSLGDTRYIKEKMAGTVLSHRGKCEFTNIMKILDTNNLSIYVELIYQLIEKQNEIMHIYKEDIIETYIKVINVGDLDSRLSSQNKNKEESSYKSLYRKINADIYGHSRYSIQSNSPGKLIGKIEMYYYDKLKIDEYNQISKLGEMMYDLGENNAHVYNTLFNNGNIDVLREAIGTRENVLFVSSLKLKDRYDDKNKNIYKKFLADIQEDIYYIFEYEIGCICVVVGEGMKENYPLTVRICKEIGFKELKGRTRSLMVFNTDNEIGAKDTLSSSDSTIYLGNCHIGEISVKGHTFKELYPFINSQILRWEAVINGVAIRIYNKKKGKIWAYEIFSEDYGLYKSHILDFKELAFEDVVDLTLRFIPDVHIDKIPKRKDILISVKALCIETLVVNGTTLFEKGDYYKFKDMGYALEYISEKTRLIVSSNYCGKWDNDDFFSKYFKLI